MKPMVLLWIVIVIVDTGWSVASGATALVSTLAIGGVLMLLWLASRIVLASRRPVQVSRPMALRAPAPVRRPARGPVHRTS